MSGEMESDFQALVATIGSIYELRGIGVSAVYVSADMMRWMRDRARDRDKTYVLHCQAFDEAGVEFGKTLKGNERVVMNPVGAGRLPVKTKYSGGNPWKIVVGYRKEGL